MPCIIHWERNGVVKKFSGLVTGPELVESVLQIANDARFGALRYEISDYLESTGTQFSQDALNEVRATRIASFEHNPWLKVAIVTRDPEIEARIYSTIAARLTLHQTRVFAHPEEANSWVGRG